jgi:Protein of unknown function (DUF2815)
MSTTKVVTGKVRLSYAFLFEARAPRENPEGEKKFSTSILIPKTDKETLTKIKAAQEAAIAAKWPGKRPAKIAMTLHDGDGVKEKTGEPYGPECKGHYVMAVSSKMRPGIVDTDMNKIIDSSEISSGDYARVSINAYAYDVSGNRGVSFGLGNSCPRASLWADPPEPKTTSPQSTTTSFPKP